ncbi:MAG: 30S ribosomal protein S6 [Phycisphaerales bacterium JB037]
MSEKNQAYYEGMFLLSQAAASDFGGAIAHINHLLERAEAEVVAMQKWDERRLAFEIDKQRRGVYILSYFKCPTDSIAGLERDINISETVMRAMFIRADHLTLEEMAAHDQRRDLETEAKLRAEKAAQASDTGASGVKVMTAEEQRAAAEAEAREKAAAEAEAESEPASVSSDE